MTERPSSVFVMVLSIVRLSPAAFVTTLLTETVPSSFFVEVRFTVATSPFALVRVPVEVYPVSVLARVPDADRVAPFGPMEEELYVPVLVSLSHVRAEVRVPVFPS